MQSLYIVLVNRYILLEYVRKSESIQDELDYLIIDNMYSQYYYYISINTIELIFRPYSNLIQISYYDEYCSKASKYLRIY